MWERNELKGNAKAVLKGNYWKAVVGALIIGALTGGSAAAGNNSVQNNAEGLGLSEFTSVFGPMGADNLEGMFSAFLLLIPALIIALAFSLCIAIFLKNPLLVGTDKMFINCKTGEANYKDIISAFKKGVYFNTVKVIFFQHLFTFLWSLLFVIPGIVKAYEYRMIPYIMAENPNMDRAEAFAKSKEMMTGNKWKTFVLDLSFIGWFFLSALTLGILNIFYVMPYYLLTDTELYYALKEQN